MPRVTWEDIRRDRHDRNVKPVEAIIEERLKTPAEQERRRRSGKLQGRLRKKIDGDGWDLYVEVKELADAGTLDLQRVAFEVGLEHGLQLGHRAPHLPEALAPVVQDLASVCADHPNESIDAALAWVLRSRLLARHSLGK